jgi:hypothetical protein
MRVVESKILYRNPRIYAAFPAVVSWPDGSVMVLFRRARDQRFLFAEGEDPDYSDFDSVDHLDCRSDIAGLVTNDELESLQGPLGLPTDIEAADQDASLLLLRDGRLIHCGFSWYPFEQSYDPSRRDERDGENGLARADGRQSSPLEFNLWGSYTRVSDDRGRTWSAHNYLPALPGFPDLFQGKRPALGGALRGQAVETSNGHILLATYLGEAGGKSPSGSHLYRSDDRGETWAYGDASRSTPRARRVSWSPLSCKRPRTISWLFIEPSVWITDWPRCDQRTAALAGARPAFGRR